MCLLSTGNLDYLLVVSTIITNSMVKPTYSSLCIHCLSQHNYCNNNGNLHELMSINFTNLLIKYSIKI